MGLRRTGVPTKQETIVAPLLDVELLGGEFRVEQDFTIDCLKCALFGYLSILTLPYAARTLYLRFGASTDLPYLVRDGHVGKYVCVRRRCVKKALAPNFG